MATAPITTKIPLSPPAVAGAGKASLPWLMAAPLLVAIGVVVAGMALRSLALVAANADLVDLAAAIERGAVPEPGYLARVVGPGGFAGAADDCNDAVTRARLTVAWAALAAADPAAPAPQQDVAMQAARRRLICDPLDGNAWLRYAMIAERGRAPGVIAALRASYRTAPSEGWVLEPRLDFVSGLIVDGGQGLAADYAADLGRFVELEPTSRIAAAYVAAPPRIRRFMRPPIDALADPRHEAILAGIDRLGVDYSREGQ